MRWTLLLGTLGLLVLGLATLAMGDDGSADDVAALARRVQVLEARVTYLSQREQALTIWNTNVPKLAKQLAAKLAEARNEGFTLASISSTSREALLAGLEGLAVELQRDPPALTEEEVRLLRQIEVLERQR